MIPKIFNTSSTSQLTQKLMIDLSINNIYSENAISFLRIPCNYKEILLRQELFVRVIDKGKITEVEQCLKLLKELERTSEILKSAKNEIEKLHYKIEQLSAYAKVIQFFSELNGLGTLFFDVSDYFNKQKNIALEMTESINYCENKMVPLMSGLISISDKIWITPDDNVTDDFTCISKFAENMGLIVPSKKRFLLTVDQSLSVAICTMYSVTVSEIYQRLQRFNEINVDEVLGYIPELEFIAEVASVVKKVGYKGIKYCFPKVTQTPQYIAKGIADITLVSNVSGVIVTNDVDFTDDSISFLMGANSGGKTSYLRAVAINLILFLAGCPIFAEHASIYPFEYIDAHFTSDERFTDVGRLDDERLRVNEIFRNVGNKHSFIFFNETFSGTDNKLGFSLLKTTVKNLRKKGIFALWVTHFQEVLNLKETVLTVQVGENNQRTYRVQKTKNRFSSYANDILKKYGIDKESLKKRGESCGTKYP